MYYDMISSWWVTWSVDVTYEIFLRIVDQGDVEYIMTLWRWRQNIMVVEGQ